MSHAEFVHLHNHTEYSLLDGACRVTDDRGKPAALFNVIAKEFKMPALAITDHGNMYGAMEFYWACRDSGIKPIIGCEVYVAPGSRFDKKVERGGDNENYYHLTLLAKDLKGYQNLMHLVSLGFLEGFYYKPRVDKELLKKYHEGILCLSGCLAGEVANKLLKGNVKDAERVAVEYRDIFGAENFYLEVMDNGLEDQQKIIPDLIELSKKLNIPLVATNDCHFLRKEDAYDHDVLLCIGTGKMLDDPGRLRFSSDLFYYRSPQEMAKQFHYLPEAISNTLAVAEKINLDLNFDQLLLPHYPVPAGETAETYLEKLCRQGLKTRYGSALSDVHEKRLTHELSIINRMGFAAYFLIVWDFIHYSKSQGIPVGPGRGSGAGSLVAYTLGITDICPLHYGLLFERFLNPERRSMPDLDIDFADAGRENVIEYVRNKYGHSNCAQIITYGSMQARLVIRDVARVMGFLPAESDRIAKLIPMGSTIFEALESIPELKTLAKTDERVGKLIKTSQKLEGLKRHTGVHAAGMVIAKEEITKYSPLSKGARDVVTTQYDGNVLPKLGLLKVDFLGLRTLTIIDDTVKMIREKNPAFTLDNLDLSDEPSFKLLQEARTMGVFQLESRGMRDLLRKIKPTNIEDVIALISLYRPGPMGSGMIDDFVARKHGTTSVVYDHPVLEPILKDTYGVILYQEQVMRIATDMAGFTMGQADGLRKAMGKKIPEEIEKQRGNFVSGAEKKGIGKKLAEKVFDNIVHFGGYGFNKSHAGAYGVVSFRTAYLKANYPMEYMTALLNSEIGRSASGGKEEEESKLVTYIQDAGDMGIAILPPDVQASEGRFTIQNGSIRFGLVAIKNVGAGGAETIVEARKKNGPFKSWDDFIERIDLHAANRKVLESLIKAGAFDTFGKEHTRTRAELMARMDKSLEWAGSQKQDEAIGQGSLFGVAELAANIDTTVKVDPWSEHDALAAEKDVLGFYLSGHPLAQHQHDLFAYSQYKLDRLPPGSTDTRNAPMVRLAGMIVNCKKMLTKEKKEPYARFKLEDLDGAIEAVVFPKTYRSAASYIVPNNIVVVKGRLSARESDTELLVEEIMTIDEAKKKVIPTIGAVHIRLSTAGLEEEMLDRIKAVIAQYPGKSPVIFDIAVPGQGDFALETGLQVKYAAAFFKEIETLVGADSWELLPR